ncbi:hypothetical protein Ccrd_022976 [Cynara cardunculus var. scolymus]|uniref:Uncharacterized protein n=1 Tax=Cynara cardunculus var. scolymus TaxID=59895 RepID=A0A103XXL9_CYNCS|nr:hypothetical protein Ccrd_022976 [Cynara cardunculus var. scolymus]
MYLANDMTQNPLFTISHVYLKMTSCPFLKHFISSQILIIRKRMYKLHPSVPDNTDVVNCVVLHKLAERMVDSSPLKILNKSDPDKNNLECEITSLYGKKLYYGPGHVNYIFGSKFLKTLQLLGILVNRITLVDIVVPSCGMKKDLERTKRHLIQSL